MPTRTSRGRDIRKGFITREGWVLLSVDESQIEPRIATFRSGDEGLINVYQNDEDLYSDFATAAFRLGDERHCGEDGKWIYPTVDTWEHRRPSKICILAAIYDVTPEGLLGQMPVICRTCNKKATEHTCGRFVPLWDEQGCARLLTAFYLKYPAILEMRKADHRRARQYGYIWDMWGRILHVAAVYSVHPWVVSKALREAGNFPMQSGAQGTIKLTMAEVHDDWTANRMADVAHPLLQIHDELLYECRQDVAEEWGEHIRSRFSGCCSLGDIAIKTGMATADTWGDLEK
jgi:DNA polymerase-1